MRHAPVDVDAIAAAIRDAAARERAVGRCALCDEPFVTERAMTDHYNAIRVGRGCRPNYREH